MLVRQDLDLDVTRILQILFHVDRRIAKCGTCLGLGHLYCIDKGRLGVHHPHTSAAAAARRLDDDGVANAFGRSPNDDRIVRQLALGARYTGHTRFDHGLFGRNFVAHDANGFRRGANELKAAFFNALGKVCVFTQESVARVNGFSIGHFGSRNDGRHVEVAEVGGCGANANSLFSQLHVFGFAVSL